MHFTQEQQQIADYIFTQVALGTNGKNVLISGQGGTGKTSMITEIICILLQQGKKVAVAAMTGKATAVLRQKINKTLFEKNMIFYDEHDQLRTTYPKNNLFIETIQKMTKISKIVNVTERGESIYANVWRDPERFDYDVLIIDELSMVPQYVSLWWQKTRCLVVGLGDYCQLPEVTTKETQKEFTSMQHDLHIGCEKYVSGYGIKVLKTLSNQSLTKVLRSDNEIALLSNDLRDFSKTNREIVSIMKKWAEKAPNAIQYSNKLNDLETSPDWQIVCYTNKMCSEINDALCIGGEYPVMDDKILLYDNIGPIQKFNGDTMTLGELVNSIKKYNADPKHLTRQITVILKWNNSMPSIKSKYKLEREMAQLYLSAKKTIEFAQKMRLRGIEDILEQSGHTQQQIQEWKNDIRELKRQYPNEGECFSEIVERFHSIDEDVAQLIMDKSPQMPRMYIVNIGYGYAITTHKSQGSEFPKVCYLLEKFDKPLLYTGISRAKKCLKIINLTSIK